MLAGAGNSLSNQLNLNFGSIHLNLPWTSWELVEPEAGAIGPVAGLWGPGQDVIDPPLGQDLIAFPASPMEVEPTDAGPVLRRGEHEHRAQPERALQELRVNGGRA